MEARQPAETVDTATPAQQPAHTAMATPHLILLGAGIGDSLQLTVESQRFLARYGRAYALGLPPNLAKFLKSQRIKVTDLSPRLAPGTDFAEAYLDIANIVLERTARERPVVFLVPGHPLMFNAIGRYLAMEGKRLGLIVQAVPGVSQLDLIVGAIGLDVSTFGLQVFDATRLVSRRIPMNPGVPALIMSVDSFAATSISRAEPAAPELGQLAAHLAGCYPPAHPVVIVNLGAAGPAVASVRLSALESAAGQIAPNSHLFLDVVRA
jgi:tetrapyrrole methylase family protein / MazG family protein